MLMGAMVSDDIVPHFTTHVVAEKITPILSQHINGLAHRTGSMVAEKKQNKNLGSWLNIQIVTIDWLRQCFRTKMVLDAEKYRPEQSLVNGAF